MENLGESLVNRSFSNPRGQNPSHPRNPFQFKFPSYSDRIPSCSSIESKIITKPAGGLKVQHHRASSDGNLIEQPYWLEELLNEPDSLVYNLRHRRASSDSAALMNSVTSLRSLISSTNNNITAEISESSHNVQKSGGNVSSEAISKNNQEKNSSVRNDRSNAGKQQFARNSRLRKLKYIAELERNVQILQAKGLEVSAALQYHNDEIVILGMENQALKQRIDNLSQEQLLKYMERDLLKREIGRLQILYQELQQKMMPFEHALGGGCSGKRFVEKEDL